MALDKKLNSSKLRSASEKVFEQLAMWTRSGHPRVQTRPHRVERLHGGGHRASTVTDGQAGDEDRGTTEANCPDDEFGYDHLPTLGDVLAVTPKPARINGLRRDGLVD